MTGQHHKCLAWQKVLWAACLWRAGCSLTSVHLCHMRSCCWHKTHRECRPISKQLPVNGNVWAGRCVRKLATDGKHVCQMLLPAQSVRTTATCGPSNWITLPLLLGKSPGVEENCQISEGYYIDISLIIADALTMSCFCLIVISSTALYTWCAFSQLTAHSRSSIKKSAHQKFQAFFRKLTLLLMGPTHMPPSTGINLPEGGGRGWFIQHAWSSKWSSENKDFYGHD